MPHSGPVTILIVGERAEETKLATISFRGFFPDCRVDAAYSADEATGLAGKAQDYHLILLDAACLTGRQSDLIEQLKRLTPYAVVLLQSDQTDSESAITAMQAGADFFLAKRSPGFVIELLFCAREALARRALRLESERALARHQQLTESLHDVCYELDREGRFVAVSPPIAPVLGFSQEELLGLPYQTLFALEDQQAALYRFNERRSGARSARQVLLRFRKKDGPLAPATSLYAEVSARGLYDSHRRFLGTIGVIRDRSLDRQQEATIRQLREKLQRTEELQTLAAQIRLLSEELQRPLSSLLGEAHQLLRAVKETRLIDRLEQFSEHAAAATDLGNRLVQTSAQASGRGMTVNDLLERALLAIGGDTVDHGIDTALAPMLPIHAGDHERTVDFLRRFLLSARTYLNRAGRLKRLRLTTTGVGLPSTDAPALFPLSPPTEVEIEIAETDRAWEASAVGVGADAPDLLQLQDLVGPLGGSIDISAPASGPLRLTVRLPMKQDLAPISTPPVVATASSMPPADVAPAQREQPSPAPLPAAVTPSKELPKERRAAARVATTLPAKITLEGTTWDGIVTNFSSGGACLTLPGDFPAIARQEAYIALRTAAGMLEMSGDAFLRTSRPAAQPPALLKTQLIVTFHPMPPTDAAVLSSFVDAARDRTLSFSMELLLATVAGSPPTQILPDQLEQERRESIRVTVNLPARLEFGDPSEGISRVAAQTINISRDGACLIVNAAPQRLQGSFLLHFAPKESFSHVGSHEPGAPGSALPATVVWSISESSGAPGREGSETTRIGVRFLSLTPYAEREVTRMLRQHLATPSTGATTGADAWVMSVPRECRNAKGQTIAIVDDHLRQPAKPDTPVVILAPGYGQTASDYVALAYFLALHHVRVLRYDHTNHVGMSEGELQHTTLRSMQTDLAKVVEFVHHTWPAAPVIVLASDLAARAAIKLAAQAQPFALLLLVNPVIDVGALLLSVHAHDLISDYRYGVRRGIANVLGFNVNLDQFVGDLIAGRFTDLASSLEDIRLVRSPLGIVTSPRSGPTALWATDLPHAFLTAIGTQARMVSLPTALTTQPLHVQEPRPAAFRLILEQIASTLGLPATDVPFGPQIQQSLMRQRRIERERMRLQHNVSQIGRDALAMAHMQHLQELGNLHEYRKLLEDLYGLIAPLTQGMTVVDAGIGQGDLTRALLVSHTYRTKQRGIGPESPSVLVGVGRSQDTLQKARQHVQTLRRELTAAAGGGLTLVPALSVEWIQADWATALPFHNGSVDRLVCNLSLSFVASPASTLREWYRVLHPEGRLVLTAFLPDSDLAPLYRQHLRLANQDEFSAQPQITLHYLGRLREAIRHGTLHSFDLASLTALLKRAGNLPFRITPILDGLAWGVVVGKRYSSSSPS